MGMSKNKTNNHCQRNIVKI
uniref:Uncharacterized protein n=1 Tax=Vitis vinifera TaxID=29760 RepID=F6GVF6_VITVI